MKIFDAAIIGGGIIGCSLARLLAGAGLKVAIVERGAPGEEASWAAAGMLSPSSEAEKGSPLFELCRASFKLYAPLAEELQQETGIDPQYRTEGTLLLFENEAERQAMLPSLEWQRSLGIAIEELSSRDVRQREPRLAPLPGAFYLPEDHQIDNRLLMQALVASCRRRGVELVLGKPARQVVRDAARNGNGALGVVLDNDRIEAARVVNTAGAWAASIRAGNLEAPPIRPVKGHMVALETAEAPFRHVVRSHRGYLVPRNGGRVIVGSTMEEAGFDKTPRAEPLAKLLRTAQDFCPVLGQSAVAETWAGLRPATPDNLPVIGPTALENYFLALGHFRNGILLAPITAHLVASWLLTGKPPLPVDALRPDRFAKSSDE